MAKKLSKSFKNIEKIAIATYEELLQVEEIGEKIAESIIKYFSELKHKEIIERLKVKGLQMEVIQNNSNVSNILNSQTFVVSGVFTTYSRDGIKETIENNGGKVLSAISAKTNYLVAGDKMGPEKLKKAEKLGIRIISEHELTNMISEI